MAIRLSTLETDPRLLGWLTVSRTNRSTFAATSRGRRLERTADALRAQADADFSPLLAW